MEKELYDGGGLGFDSRVLMLPTTGRNDSVNVALFFLQVFGCDREERLYY